MDRPALYLLGDDPEAVAYAADNVRLVAALADAHLARDAERSRRERAFADGLAWGAAWASAGWALLFILTAVL